MRRCLSCRKPIPRGPTGRRRVYCTLKCQQMVRRLNSLCKHSAQLPDILLLPLAAWQRAYWHQQRENADA